MKRIALLFIHLVIILLLLGSVEVPVFAQTLAPVGSNETLDIATWNIEWFGSTTELPSNDALQLANARKVIAESEIDLWGVQEISNPSAFEDLINALGDNYAGQLATYPQTQKIGFIYNTDVIRVRQVRHVLESAESFFAFRPPLQMEVDVTLPDTVVTMTFIVVHMKARADMDSYERRQSASVRLKNHIDFTTLGSKPVVVLGDFNDQLRRSIYANRTTPYDNFLQDPDQYLFLSYQLELDGEGSFCTSSSCSTQSSMIDHVLISNELFGALSASEAAGVLDEAADVIGAFGASTSDHVPVYARFSFGNNVTSNNKPDDIPARYTVGAPYPNPVRSQVKLTYELSTPLDVTIQLFDASGRLLTNESRTSGNIGVQQVALDVSSLAAGAYFLRVGIDGKSNTFPVTVLN